MAINFQPIVHNIQRWGHASVLLKKSNLLMNFILLLLVNILFFLPHGASAEESKYIASLNKDQCKTELQKALSNLETLCH